MIVYILTYDKPHRKTQDVVQRLRAVIPDNNLRLTVLPWVDRKNHKPLYPTKLPPAKIEVHQLGLKMGKLRDVRSGSLVVIAGAGLLPPAFVKFNTVINSHCGWLPVVRGLDALKWAIYYDYPIGCTTHIIDDQIDRGLLIERRRVTLSPTDSLFSVAMKQYDLELEMLVDCIYRETWKQATEFSEPAPDPTRRMPHLTELQMIKRLEKRLR